MVSNLREMVRKILAGEEIECPMCKKGTFSANPKIDIKYQNTFYCSNCKKKLVIN